MNKGAGVARDMLTNANEIRPHVRNSSDAFHDHFQMFPKLWNTGASHSLAVDNDGEDS
jgi:hypothetical protein